MNKRGISTIIASVLIVLITVAGVSLLWLGLGSFLDVDIKTFDTRISIVTSTGYTFYDPQNSDGTVLVQVESRGMDTPDYLQLILTLADGSEKVSVHDAPFSNARTTLYLNAQNIDPKKVSVAPIFVIDGKAVLGNRIRPIDLPRRNENQVTFYSSFSDLREPDGVYVEKGPLATGGGGGSENTGKPGSPIPPELCPLVSECQDQDGDGIADSLDCFGGVDNGYYTICTCEDLQMIGLSTGGITESNDGNNLNDNYILMNDIDCSATSDESSIWDSNGFDPIGEPLSAQEVFSGHFDGNNKEIRNLFINRPLTSYVGLFGIAFSGAIIENVNLVAVDVTGDLRVGGLIGDIEVGTISNVVASGSVMGKTNVGGQIGYTYQGRITNVHFSGDVTGDENVGGLIGYDQDSDITDATYEGTVTGTGSYVGGLIGYSI